MIVKYSQDNGFGLIIDTSKPWPQSPVVIAGDSFVDITKAVVDIYNAQSGVPAPASTGAAKPAAPRVRNRHRSCEACGAQADRATQAVKTGHLWCLKSSSRPRENAAFFLWLSSST